MLLWPTPWIGSTSTRPEILYGPTRYKTGPLTFNTYFPAGSFVKPLKEEKRVLNNNSCLEIAVTHSILVKRCDVNPVKSTSVNFNSTFTGLSAPCLIKMLGICNGSIGIKLMPLWPSGVNKKEANHSKLINLTAIWKPKKKLITFWKQIYEFIRYSNYTIRISNRASFDIFCCKRKIKIIIKLTQIKDN